MSSTKEFRDYILEQLKELGDITCRPMMGEYLLYYKNILFGGLYDNRLLLKRGFHNQQYQLREEIPYAGAKPMYAIDDLDNKALLEEIILETCKDFKPKK